MITEKRTAPASLPARSAAQNDPPAEALIKSECDRRTGRAQAAGSSRSPTIAIVGISRRHG